MLSAFVRAFKTPDLRRKILFTLGIMAIYRLGTHIPSPGIDYGLVQQCQQVATQAGSVLGMANLFSGGAMMQLSVFALGIMPYITAAIIVQLLTVVIPRFEQLKKEGQAGQTKMTQYTRYLTIGLAVLQASTLVVIAREPARLFGGTCSTIMPDDGVGTLVLMVLTMTAGTGLIMWLGELITEKGIGNGMSLLIFVSIAATFPASLSVIYQQSVVTFVLVMALGLAIMTAVVYVEQSSRRIPVQYAKRMVGRRQYGGTSTYIPLKLNMANVIPLIFASSILMLPQLVANFNRPVDATQSAPEWVTFIDKYLSMGMTGQGTHWVYMLLYTAMILFFTFFYVSVTFNPTEVADNMKRYGGFIPGIRAGRPTAEYLQYVITRITTPGALYLAILALIPLIAFNMLQVTDFPLGGASILIIVGVGLQTVKQIESQLQQHDYEGFLR
ncbi:preprotein translocase subunit SecY [Ornithinimicrobium humiphilum]|uniref:Protein translocase subunit SecY n=1 Tax=Ornithinimicrobium humiphilum TaxID=125288 RepID=A0A543KR74_9MICO|nr:preprotein translocase subunit SecY [Ornithinimicrobium humiphilum]TQM97577.1 protein translocase subunit secY/sec61 alpha [Ornithinimicrobium humiphilum]